jgi:hypothetical protein
MFVKLTYFQKSGKYYTESEYTTQLKNLDFAPYPGLWEIFAEVQQMRDSGNLPGLVKGAKEFHVLVDVPEHPHRHPALILL